MSKPIRKADVFLGLEDILNFQIGHVLCSTISRRLPIWGIKEKELLQNEFSIISATASFMQKEIDKVRKVRLTKGKNKDIVKASKNKPEIVIEMKYGK